MKSLKVGGYLDLDPWMSVLQVYFFSSLALSLVYLNQFWHARSKLEVGTICFWIEIILKGVNYIVYRAFSVKQEFLFVCDYVYLQHKFSLLDILSGPVRTIERSVEPESETFPHCTDIQYTIYTCIITSAVNHIVQVYCTVSGQDTWRWINTGSITLIARA